MSRKKNRTIITIWRNWKLILVQAVIILLFVCLFAESMPIALEDTSRQEIVIENTKLVHGREPKLYVYSESMEYRLYNATFSSYSANELYDMLSIGEKITIMYYDSDSIWPWNQGKIIIDARNDNHVFLDVDDYYAGKESMPVVSIVLFLLFELLFFCYIKFFR